MSDQPSLRNHHLTWNPVKLARYLFFVNAAVWLVFGAISLLRLNDRGMSQPAVMLVVTVLVAGNTGAMLLAGWWLAAGRRWAYLFSLALLGANILLTFTDQFGILDLLTLLLDLFLLGLLLATRSIYFVRT